MSIGDDLDAPKAINNKTIEMDLPLLNPWTKGTRVAMMTAEEIARRQFDIIDTDGDALVNGKDILGGDPYWKPRKVVLRRLMKGADWDGDGKNNEDEFTALMRGKAATLYVEMDKDASGLITKDESKLYTVRDKAFDKVDKDKNGKLCFEEFLRLAGLQEMLDQRDRNDTQEA